jgi:NAD(P)-dependent dehydrogenase (short-subunit alcohol dehydrogenase family)
MDTLQTSGRASALPNVIVTGSGGAGCGRAIALRFARDGARVVVSDIDDAAGRETVALIERAGGRALFCHADVRDEAQCRALVERCMFAFGAVSVLVNNASSAHQREAGIRGWRESIETDLLGTLHATHWAVEAMRREGRGGSIVNIASISALWHGRNTPGGFPGYDVAKAGMIRMTTRLGCLKQTDGIRVSCLAPGWIGTPEVRSHWESMSATERAELGIPSMLIDVNDLADVVARMANDESLAGRVVAWWSEDGPKLIEWGDRGYRKVSEYSR